ncbi:hypothetical protein VCHENC02_2719B, partial [Vibrio harveyi]
KKPRSMSGAIQKSSA